jgi:hypothetical protein
MTESGSEARAADEWELEAHPRKSAKYAIAVAVLLVVIHTTLGILLRTGNTGVFFQRADQVAMIAIGCGLAGGVLLLTRPRIKVGAQGVLVSGARLVLLGRRDVGASRAARRRVRAGHGHPGERP